MMKNNNNDNNTRLHPSTRLEASLHRGKRFFTTLQTQIPFAPMERAWRASRGVRTHCPQILLLTLTLLLPSALNSFAPVNVFNIADPYKRTPTNSDNYASFDIFWESGSRSKGRTNDHGTRNVLAIYDQYQLPLQMLLKPRGNVIAAIQPVIREIEDLVMAGLMEDFLDPAHINIPGTDIPRGRQNFIGAFTENDCTLRGAYYFGRSDLYGSFGCSCTVPVVEKHIDKAVIEDLTALGDSGVEEVKNIKKLITTDLKGNVMAWGNLDLSPWNKSGVGDIALTLEWRKEFAISKELFRYATLFAHLGVTCPTGSQKDEDRAFSMPLGNDGSLGVPLGGGIHIDALDHISAGLEYQITYLNNVKRVRRLKTDVSQTEFLLLNKGMSSKEYGSSWSWDAFFHVYRVIQGLGFKLGYQFVRHEQDRLRSKDSDFDDNIINTANSLKPWQTYNLLFAIDYDFYRLPHPGAERQYRESNRVSPYISVFAKLSHAGKNVIDVRTIGWQLAFTF